MSDGDVSVKVAIRVRPQSPREIIDCCRICTNFVPGEPQIILGSDKAFTYDKVFEMSTGQREIYEATIKELVESCFKGYNSTILAYGQTGSGKTYTMGTQFDECIREQQRGLIPRAVDHLFQNIRNMKEAALAEDLPPPDFKVSAQFMELYNEEILDLLSPSGEAKGKKSNLKIHEDANGEIYVDGMSSQDVANTEEVLLCLQQGALCRTTASTQMNAVSSRSHALFSLKMHIMKALKTEDGSSEFENLTSKLVFVDLAGSERLKRTGATGDRAKEGISINGGLLALGNVISALGDEKRKAAHVPYRDSKLTRLLQDSLGGNSQTLMVACVSPSDRDFMETLNTLKYANRAKNIKNKVVVNQDKTSRMINMLREENMKLQQELMEYRMGQRTGEEGNYSDLFTENAMLRADNDKLRLRIKSMKEAQDTKDENIAELRAKAICASVIGSDETDMTEMIQGYMKEIESLRTQLLEQETAAKYRSPVKPGAVAPAARLSLNASGGGAILNDSIVDVIKEAKDDLEKTMAKRSKLAHLMDLEQTKVEDNKENILEEEEEEEENEEEEMDCENNFIDIDDDMEDITTIKSEKEKPQEEGGGEEEEEEEAKHRIENIHIIEQDLADLGDEISIKQKLLEELERSQKKIHNLKMVYEEKLNTLQNMMRQTCDERDEVLENLRKNSDSNKNKEEIKSKGDHYTKKIKDMEKEMKRLRTAKLEHEKMEKKSKAQEKQLKDIQTEITNMKRNKVKLMRQLKEETAKSKKVEQKKQQEIVKLQREKQKQNTQIKKLQMEQKTKDMVLKRKQEEIKMMKKQKNALSVKKLHNSVRNRPGVMRNQASAVAEQEQEDDRNGRRLSSQYSSFSARQKWNQLERRINQNIIRKHTVAHMEAEMDRLVKDRERLEKDLDQFIKKKDKILKGKDPNGEELQELDENIEGLSAQVEYLQENINEHQTHIVEMMDGRESGDTLDLQDIIDNCSLPDCKYLLEHFLSFTTTKGLAAAQSNIKVKEVEATVKSLRQALEETEQKLVDQYNVAEKQIEVKEEDEKDNVEDAVLCNASMFNTPSKTYSMLCATPGRKFFPQPSSASPPITETRLAAVLEDKVLRRRTGTPVEFQSPLTGSRESIGSDSQLMPPPAVTLTAEDVSPSASPSLERRDSVRRRNGGGSLGSTTDNVFERLHSQTDEPAPEGHVVPCDEKTSHPQISCVSLVKGHTHSVQSVSVHGKIMVTGSSDRTIRIWDLSDGKEAQRASFSDPVKKVVYSTGESVVYALTNQCLKAWDIRTDPKTCRSTTLAEFPSALLYPPGSDFIYFSTGISVRSWNVGQWTAAGVLHGHSGHVMCLEYVQFDDKKYIITGSRDHFCKIYDARDGIISSRVPTATLNPPHFDGIESIVCVEEHLYSGSRDATIKKWHLPSKKEKGAQRPAHKDRVQALTYVPTLSGLASVSRNGSLKVWSEENFGAAKSDHSKSLIAEVNAHPGSSINDVTFHDDHVFTASGDTTVKIWAVK